MRLDGQKYYVVKVTLNGRSAALVQLLPANTFLLHYGVYLWLVALGIAIIWGLSFLMQHWLEWVITRPVEALQKRIETVGSGNFAPDRTVEWNNELGDIGRGINQLAENVDSLMTRRVEDERRKQELEYRMLQNEVNPHFIYNTLNSIRWMATIQHAPGIAEMVMALSRLLKSISKSNERLVPLYDLCRKYHKPIIFHAGFCLENNALAKYARPMEFEEVALRWPEINLCLAHFGWPWVQETAALLLKYPNLYANTALMNFDGPYQLFPKVFKQDMGEYWLDHNLADKVMFGSDSPRIRPVRSKRGLDSVEMLPETREKIYWKNAMRFFGWEGQNK